MTFELVLAVGQSIFSLISISFHIVGLILLRQTTSSQVNQKIYLIHLSIIEIIFLTSHNAPLYLKIVHPNETIAYYYVGLSIIVGIALPWYNLLIAITVDRFLQVYLNIKYELYITQKITKGIIFCCWLFGITLWLILFLLKYLKDVDSIVIVHTFILQAYHSSVIVVFLLTYGYIYYRIKKMNNSDTSINDTQNVKTNFIPFWIVISFIFFILVPETIHFFVSLKDREGGYSHGRLDMFIAAMMLFDVGCLVDALLYILLNRFIRERFCRLVHSWPWSGYTSP